RAAGEIRDIDVEAGLLEVAEPLRDRERKVIEGRLAAHREANLGGLELLCGRNVRAKKRAKNQCGSKRGRRQPIAHAILPLAIFESFHPVVTAMLSECGDKLNVLLFASDGRGAEIGPWKEH